nr:hypothetical protein [Tanacetum cinerariifolium]
MWKASVSRPHLKSNPQGDRVLRSNSRGKKLEVEEHRRNVKLPKNKPSITACNDSLNVDACPNVCEMWKASVSRPHLKSNPQGDRVLRSNSRGKKLE